MNCKDCIHWNIVSTRGCYSYKKDAIGELPYYKDAETKCEYFIEYMEELI